MKTPIVAAPGVARHPQAPFVRALSHHHELTLKRSLAVHDPPPMNWSTLRYVF
jgi:hypothetical protein